MPDENKFEGLRSIEYGILITCGLCVHGPWVAEIWGECAKHRYQHIKHKNPERGRGLSVHVTGTCLDAEADPRKIEALGAHKEFLT